MEIQRIDKLINEWDKATDKVIEFENPGYEKVRALFKETFELLDKYGKDKLVPKEISGLLLEMNKFGWWVSDLEETPLHDLYQEIVSLLEDDWFLKWPLVEWSYWSRTLYGIGRRKNVKQSVKNLIPMAKAGNPGALFDIGFCHRYSGGLEINYDKRIWFFT